MPWIYNPSLHRYENTTTGRSITEGQTLDFINQSIEAGQKTLADALVNASTPTQFNQLMREQIKLSHIQQYLAGRGGLGQMTEVDWGSIGGMLANQYRYLDRMVLEWATLSEAAILSRAMMYIASSRQAYERGKIRARGLNPVQFPTMPGQNSRCLTNCKCSWEIQERKLDGVLTGYDCYWRLGATEEHCPDCSGFSSAYSPFRINL